MVNQFHIGPLVRSISLWTPLSSPLTKGGSRGVSSPLTKGGRRKFLAPGGYYLNGPSLPELAWDP